MRASGPSESGGVRGMWKRWKKDFIVFICISRFRCNLNLSSFLLLVALKGKGKKRILMVPLSEEKINSMGALCEIQDFRVST